MAFTYRVNKDGSVTLKRKGRVVLRGSWEQVEQYLDGWFGKTLIKPIDCLR